MTMKKTMLNIVSASGRPAKSGNVAKMMGTGPRSPTQQTIAFSRRLKGEKNKANHNAEGAFVIAPRRQGPSL
jgi:hypothetical protein